MSDLDPKSSRLIDLTKRMDDALGIYAEDGYSDPPLVIEDWCSIMERGFRVSRLELGTQTGTHIDAPAHFAEGAATLDALDPAALIGPYLALRPSDWANEAAWRAAAGRHRGEGILFLLADTPTAALPEAAFDRFLALGCPVWATASEIDIPGAPALHFHQRLAERGIYLIEDLDREAAREVSDTGEMIALPLRLIGTSGAPCRVVIRTAG